MSSPIIQIPGDLTTWLNVDAAFGSLETNSIITRVQLTLSNAPSGGALVVRISDTAGGAGDGISVTIADGQVFGSQTGSLSVAADATLYARVTTVNGSPMDLVGSIDYGPLAFAGDISGEVLSLAAVKSYLKIDDGASDDDLTLFIVAARKAAEQFMSHSLVEVTKTAYPDIPVAAEVPWWGGVKQGSLPHLQGAPNQIFLPEGPVQSITSIKSFDDADAETVFASGNYYLDAVNDHVVLRNNAAWPAPERKVNGFEVVYLVGYADVATVAAPIKLGMLQHIAAMMEHRGDDKDVEIPSGAKLTYHPFKRDWMFG